MKYLTMSVVVALFAAGGVMADPVHGTWKTAPDDNGNFGHISVAACGAKICGVLIKAFGPDGKEIQSENVGKRIIWDMENQGGGRYGKGKIWSPDRDKTYSSKLNLNDDTLAVSGCVFGICRDGGKWRRVD